MKKNILLIGHKSFIGKEFKKKILSSRNDFNLLYLKRHFCEKDILFLDTEKFLKKYFINYKKIDIVLSCLHIHKNKSVEELNLNLKIYKNILNFCEYLKIKKIIYISSVNVSKNKNYHYAYVKFKIENLIKKYKYFTIIRPSTVIKIDKKKFFFGGKNGGNFVFLEKLLKFNLPIPIVGDGKYLFTICLLSNLSDFILVLLKKNFLINKTINFFSGEYMNFNNFIDHFSRIKKKKLINFIYQL